MKRNPIHRLTQRARRFGVATVVSSLLLAVLVPTALAGAAPTSITFDYIAIGSSCVYGQAAPNLSVELTWKDSSGALKYSETQTSTDSGSLYFCPPDDTTVLAIGDRLKATDGFITHKLVIPTLTIDINRVTNRLFGRAPAGATVRLECGGGPLPRFEPCMWTKRVAVDSAGDWAKSVPWDVIGGESFAVRWKSAGGDFVYAGAFAPYVTVTLGQSRFSGATGVGQGAHLSLADPTTHAIKARGNVVGGPAGKFSGRFKNNSGNAVPVSAGDELDGYVSPDADMIVPNVEATASAATNIVSGRCFDTGRSNRAVFLHLIRGGHERGWVFEDTAPDGTFVVDFMADGFRDSANVKVGDKILVQCMQTAGDWVNREIVAGP